MRAGLRKFWEDLTNEKLIGAILDRKNVASYPETIFYNHTSAHHPIKHILSILFLFDSFNDFLKSYEADRKAKPLPLTLEQYQTPREKTGLSHTLKDKILEMLKSGGSMRQIARTLGLSLLTVKNTALQNQIKVDRRPSKIFNQERRYIWRKLHMGASTHEIANDLKASAGAIEQILNSHPILIELRKKIRFFTKRAIERDSILNYLSCHRTAGRNEIRIGCNKAYLWLFKHDSDWLYKHLPSAIPRSARYDRSK